MNRDGRIALWGAISIYNATHPPPMAHLATA
jgi:hypothetical protein